MKARKQLGKETERRIEQAAAARWEQEGAALVERTMKLALVAARQEFDFGAQRLKRLAAAMSELAEEREKNPETFYSHIDRVLIDEMGLPFDRETDADV